MMSGDGYDKYRIQPAGTDALSLKQRIIAKRKPILISLLLIGALAFAAGWNPPTDTVHDFTEASDFNARRESGCTNSGDGCHGEESRYADFNTYHPETDCNVCHDYTGVGCAPCHAPAQHECTGCHDGSMEGASNCARLGGSFPKGHYRESLHEAMGTDMTQVVLAAEGGTAQAACQDCHAKDLRQAHTGVPEVEDSTYGPEIGCAECHNDTASGALDQVLADWEQHRCEDCHGEESRAPMHDAKIATAVEATGDSGCAATGEGCHALSDLHALHPDSPATCAGSAVEGEPGCHDLNLQSALPTATACGVGEGTCHAPYRTDDYTHENDASVHLASTQGGMTLTDPLSLVGVSCSSCHSMELGSEHARAHVNLGPNPCVECHNKSDITVGVVLDSWPEKASSEACDACHESKHLGIGVSHTARQVGENGQIADDGCVRSGCHETADVRVLHKAVGCMLAGCHSNTGAISGSVMKCGGADDGTGCHAGSIASLHTTVHRPITPAAADLTNLACISSGCHTNALVAAHNDGECSVSCHYFEPEWPQGCRCHATGATRPTGELAHTMQSAMATSGAGLVCTTCHKADSRHFGHDATTHDDAAASGECTSCHDADLIAAHAGACSCHSLPALAPTLAALFAEEGPAECRDCHAAGGDVASHEPIHVPIAPASVDTTNTACVQGVCHGNQLVTAHEGGECSATCHYFELEYPQACRCHATSVTRPAGALAGYMADAIANNGEGLVCTTCHHPGTNHLPHDETTHADATGTQSLECVTCHGSTDLPTVHDGGCTCHGSPLVADRMPALLEAGAAECRDCHPQTTEVLHEPIHVPIAPASVDTTNTACVDGGCHGSALVAAHEGGECSASCHYFEPEWPQGCRCHATAVTRPTGALAGYMADAISNNGEGLVCTTCHHPGTNHLPHDETTHVDATGTQSLECVTCHDSTDLPTVHDGGCVCHGNPALEATMDALLAAGAAECRDCHAREDCTNLFPLVLLYTRTAHDRLDPDTFLASLIPSLDDERPSATVGVVGREESGTGASIEDTGTPGTTDR